MLCPFLAFLPAMRGAHITNSRLCQGSFIGFLVKTAIRSDSMGNFFKSFFMLLDGRKQELNIGWSIFVKVIPSDKTIFCFVYAEFVPKLDFF